RLTDADAPERTSASLTVRSRPGFFADKHDVLAAIDDDEARLVHALPEAHFKGENDDYGRRGHIPTSVNIPAASLVDD
ncbi:MAG: hypothetical protein GWO04_02765, partial [Actinobacteria bacterium]|nr:hypothetical protein [Actinomycetota bacterium]